MSDIPTRWRKKVVDTLSGGQLAAAKAGRQSAVLLMLNDPVWSSGVDFGLSAEDAVTIADALYEAAGATRDECSGETVGWMVGELTNNLRDPAGVWTVDDLAGAEATAKDLGLPVHPLHRGPIHADYRKPRQCEWNGAAGGVRCWRNEHAVDERHVYPSAAGDDLIIAQTHATSESRADAIVAAVRDRDAREASE